MREVPLTRFDTYLLKSLAVATVFVTAGLSMAIWLTQSLRLVELVVEGGAPLGVFLQLALLTLPTFLATVLPIGLLVAVLFTYNRLIVDSELVVMRAAGVGPLRLARPALVFAGIVSLLCYALTLYLAPAAARELVRIQTEVRDEYAAVLLRPGTFNDVGDGLTVYVRGRGAEGELYDLTIHDTRDPAVKTTVVAERGLLMDTDGQRRVMVFSGTQMKFHAAEGRVEWLEFARSVVDLQTLRQGLGERWPDPRERRLEELIVVSSDDPRDARFAARLRAELHQRLALPLLPLPFVAIALVALVPGEFSRRGQYRRIAAAAGAALAIQAGLLGVANLVGKTPALAPVLYLGVLLPAAVSLAYLKHWRLLRRRGGQPAALAAG